MSSTPLSVLLVLDADRTPADVVGATRAAAAALADHGHVRLTVVERASDLVSAEGASVVHAVGPTALGAAQRVLAGRSFPALVCTSQAPRHARLGPLAARLPVRRAVDRWVVHGSRAAAALVESGRLPADRLEVLPLLPLAGAPSSAAWEARRRQARDALGVLPGADVVVGMGRPEAEPAFRGAAAELARTGVLPVWLDADAGTGWSWRGGQAVRVSSEPAQLLPAMDLLVGLGRSGRARSASVDAWRAGVPVLATADDDGATLVAHLHPVLLLRRPDRRQIAAAALALTSRYPVTRRPCADGTWHRVNGTVEPLARALLGSWSAALGLPQHLVAAGGAVTAVRAATTVAVPAQRGPGIPFAVTEITAEAQQAAAEVLASGWVTTGPRVLRFEADLEAYTGARHAVAVSSCTAALELSLRALDLAAGAPVLTPTLTFCGAVHAIVHAGLRPVLVDVDPGGLTPSPDTTARAARRAGGAAGMVVQHMAGQPLPVADLAAAAGLPAALVVEDAAHAIGARYADGRHVGAGGTAACLSFYATKNLPIGEGGAVLTDDDEVAQRIRRARLHGMSHDAWRRYLPGGSWRYDVELAGMKANLTDVQAAIGSAQLGHLDRWQARRAELAARYDQGLDGLEGVSLPPRPEGGDHAWHLYVVRVVSASSRSRDEVAERLGELGIGTSVHFIPVHRLSWFRRLLGPEESASCPNADAAYAEILSLPLHPLMSDDQVDRVCDAVRSATTP